MALASSRQLIHHAWMTEKTHQSKLYSELGEAIGAPDTPDFMTAEREALALISLCRQVSDMLQSGVCPLIKLMVLSQQALRCAAVACAQDDKRNAMVNDLIKRTMPS
jgi:hypothetical protein